MKTLAKKYIRNSLWLATIALASMLGTPSLAMGADSPDQKPILGIATLGRTTFGEVVAKLRAKKCAEDMGSTEVFTHGECLGLPGNPGITFFRARTTEERHQIQDPSIHAGKEAENYVVVEVEIFVANRKLVPDYLSSLEKTWGKPEITPDGDRLWKSGNIQVLAGTGNKYIPPTFCRILYSLSDELMAKETAKADAEKAAKEAEESKERQGKLDGLL
ncbi:MAG: hypothetical protein LUC43_07805 [Burkholderiales bacterium]|nr:hypothetical protein [Burkholderiales bacterium]